MISGAIVCEETEESKEEICLMSVRLRKEKGYDPAQETWVVGGKRDLKSDCFLGLGNKNDTNAIKKGLLNVEAVY